MIPYALPNIDASVVSVDTTARTLAELISIAASESFEIPSFLDGVDLNVSGDIRIATDGLVPTSSKGFKLGEGIYKLRGLNLNELRLISVSGTVSVDVQIGRSSEGESDVVTVAGGGGGGGGLDLESKRLAVLSLEASGFIPFLDESTLADNLTTDGGELSTVDVSSTATFDTNGYVSESIPSELDIYYELSRDDNALENKADDGFVAEVGTDTTTIVITGNPARNGDWVYNRTRKRYTKVQSGGGTNTLTVSPAINGQTEGDDIGFTDIYSESENPPAETTIFGLPAIDISVGLSAVTYIDGTTVFPSNEMRIGFAISPDDVSREQWLFITPAEDAVSVVVGYITTSGTFAISTLNESFEVQTPIVESPVLTIGEEYLIFVDYDGTSDISIWMNGTEVDTATGITLTPSNAKEIYWFGVDLGDGLTHTYDGKIGNIGVFTGDPGGDMSAFLTTAWNSGSPFYWAYATDTVIATIEDSETYQRTIPTTVSTVTFVPVYTGTLGSISAVIKDSGGTEIAELTVNGETTIPTAAQGDVKGGDLEIRIESDGTKLNGYYLSLEE